MKQAKVLFLSALFALSVLLVHSTRSQAQEKKHLRIVFVSLSWNNQLPYRIAIAKGFFRDQGLSVEQIFVRGGPTAIAALISGNVDFGSIGGAQAAIRSNARGLDLHILALTIELHQLHSARQQRHKVDRRTARQNHRRHRSRRLLRFCH